MRFCLFWCVEVVTLPSPKDSWDGISNTTDYEFYRNSCRNKWMEGKYPFIPKVNNCVDWPAAWIYLKATIVQEPQSQTASSNSPANWFDWSVFRKVPMTQHLLIMSSTCFSRHSGNVQFFPLVLTDPLIEKPSVPQNSGWYTICSGSGFPVFACYWHCLSYALLVSLGGLDLFWILCFNSWQFWCNFSFSETLSNAKCQNEVGS